MGRRKTETEALWSGLINQISPPEPAAFRDEGLTPTDWRKSCPLGTACGMSSRGRRWEAEEGRRKRESNAEVQIWLRFRWEEIHRRQSCGYERSSVMRTIFWFLQNLNQILSNGPIFQYWFINTTAHLCCFESAKTCRWSAMEHQQTMTWKQPWCEIEISGEISKAPVSLGGCRFKMRTNIPTDKKKGKTTEANFCHPRKKKGLASHYKVKLSWNKSESITF